MKKNKFFYILTYYNIIPILFFGIVIFLFKDNISEIFCFNIGLEKRSEFYQLYCLAIEFGLISFWIYFTYTSTREKRYAAITGRNYNKDHSEYNKTYSQLIQFWKHSDPYKIDIDKLPEEDWKNADGVILCKSKNQYGNYCLVKRNSNANGNLVSFGLPGSGKSTTQAATTAVRFNTEANPDGCGVFAISIKGDLLNFVRDKRKNIKVFTPDKEEGSCHYDPLLGVTEMSWTERRIFAENMSLIICPDEEGDNSAFFVNGARDYLTSIILYLLYLHDIGERKGDLKFPEIIDTILQNNVFDITLTIKDCGNPIPGEYTNGFIGSSEKNISGIWSHLCKCIRPFNSGALRTLFNGEGSCISPDDLETGDIYIDVPQDKYLIYAPAMAIIITNFLMAFMRRPDVSSQKEVVPILFLLDEAAQLRLDFSILSQAMSTLRSKKVSLFLLMQSIAQLEGAYGETHAREIIDLCAYISVFNAQDPKSREFFQKLVGKRKVLKRSTSLSSADAGKKNTSGITINETNDFIFETADFGDLTLTLPSGKKINRVLVYANGKYILGETTPCYK